MHDYHHHHNHDHHHHHHHYHQSPSTTNQTDICCLKYRWFSQSPWYDLRSWLGVKNQLSINLSTVDYLFWINKTNWVAPGIEPGSLVRKVNLFVMTCIHLSAFASKYKWLLCSHPSPYGAPFAPNLHSATGLIFLVAQVVTGRSTGIRFRLDEIRVDEIRVD